MDLLPLTVTAGTALVTLRPSNSISVSGAFVCPLPAGKLVASQMAGAAASQADLDTVLSPQAHAAVTGIPCGFQLQLEASEIILAGESIFDSIIDKGPESGQRFRLARLLQEASRTTGPNVDAVLSLPAADDMFASVEDSRFTCHRCKNRWYAVAFVVLLHSAWCLLFVAKKTESTSLPRGYIVLLRL